MRKKSVSCVNLICDFFYASSLFIASFLSTLTTSIVSMNLKPDRPVEFVFVPRLKCLINMSREGEVTWKSRKRLKFLSQLEAFRGKPGNMRREK